MYQYQYVSVDMKQGFGKCTLEEHRGIIDKYAEDGWRFVTCIPTKILGYGQIARLDLVFEKAK